MAPLELGRWEQRRPLPNGRENRVVSPYSPVWDVLQVRAWIAPRTWKAIQQLRTIRPRVTVESWLAVTLAYVHACRMIELGQWSLPQ